MSCQHLNDAQVKQLDGYASGLSEYIDGAVDSLIELHRQYDPYTRPAPSEVNKELQQLNKQLKRLSLDAREHLRNVAESDLNLQGLHITEPDLSLTELQKWDKSEHDLEYPYTRITEPYLRLHSFAVEHVDKLIEYSAVKYRRNLDTPDDKQEGRKLEIREALLFHIRWIREVYKLPKSLPDGPFDAVVDIMLAAVSKGSGSDVRKLHGLTSNERLLKDALYSQ